MLEGITGKQTLDASKYLVSPYLSKKKTMQENPVILVSQNLLRPASHSLGLGHGSSQRGQIIVGRRHAP